MARLVGIDAYVDDQFVASIISTPTGSTADNMAAGGPIVVPGQAAMTMTLICAHSLTNRPLVIPAASTIRLQLGADVRGVIDDFGPGFGTAGSNEPSSFADRA